MSGPGMTTIAVARLPTEAARERLKQELSKDLAMLDEDLRDADRPAGLADAPRGGGFFSGDRASGRKPSPQFGF